MSDEEEHNEEEDEELTEDERKRRQLRKLLKKLIEKKLDNSKKISEGFEGAYSGQENAHKYYRHHDFKYNPEPKDQIPETKPTYISGDNFEEPQRWHQVSLENFMPEKAQEITSTEQEPIIKEDYIARIEDAARADIVPEIMKSPLEKKPFMLEDEHDI